MSGLLGRRFFVDLLWCGVAAAVKNIHLSFHINTQTHKMPSEVSVLPLVSAREWVFPQATWITGTGSGIWTRLYINETIKGLKLCKYLSIYNHCPQITVMSMHNYRFNREILPWSVTDLQKVLWYPQLSIFSRPPGENISRCTHSQTVVLATSHSHYLAQSFHVALYRGRDRVTCVIT